MRQLLTLCCLARTASVVFETTRTLAVRPQAAKQLWLSETWKRGRYGLPLPPPINLDGNERLVVPPGLREGIVDEDDKSVTYRVLNPGWLSLYPVHKHRGAVRFEDAQNATRMTWSVDYEPFDGLAAESWTAFLTDFIVSSAADELAKIASGDDQIPSPVERFVVRRLLDWFRDSELVQKEHAKHIASPTVSHLLKGTPLVDAADDNKLVFASSYLGRLVARVVKEEGEYLSEWKVAKIVEAAGPQFDAAAAREDLRKEAMKADVVVFSFTDCPWCVAAKKLLAEYDSVRDIDLEPLGQRGKTLRAAIALETGRTSMPAVYVRGEAIGGYTDGSPGLLALHRTGELDRRLM